MKKLDKRLLRTIGHSKGQFISLTIVVIVALIVYVSFSMVADQLYNSIFQYYDETNFAHIFVDVNRVPGNEVDDLLSIDGVKQVQGRVVSDVPLRVEDPNEKVNARIISVPSNEDQINSLLVLEGEELRPGTRTTSVLKQFFIGRDMEIGDTLRPYIGGTEYSLEVVAQVGSPEYIYLMENEQALLPDEKGFGVLYVPEEFAQSAFGFHGSYNNIIVTIDEDQENRIDIIADDIENQLDRFGIRSIVTREDHLSHSVMIQEVESLQLMSQSMTIIFLLVASVVISIMLSRIVKKDRIGIGVLKGLGYSTGQILMHYVKYSMAIGLTGSIIGILLSIPVSRMMVGIYIQYMNIPLFRSVIDNKYLIYGTILTTIFCVTAGLFGARSVLKISPADAMRPETPKAGKRMWIENFKGFWRRLTFSWKMVLRNISRTKRRAFFLVIGIALTFAITMIPVFMSTVWDTLFDKQYTELQKMDYSIDFSVPLEESVLLELQQLTQIEYIEPKVELPFELTDGWRKEIVNVIAIQRDTRMYGFRTPSGRQIELPQKGIIITDILARQLKAEAGDIIEINSVLPGVPNKTIEVKAVVEQYFGKNAYMDIEQMYDMVGERDIITGALAFTDTDIVPDLRDVKNIKAINSVQDMRDMIMEYMDMIIASMGTMMIFGGILGFAIVYNITIVSINERIMEFSSLRILGFEKKEIFKLITRENSLMTFFGLILGVPIGYAMCTGLVDAVSTEMYTIPAVIEPFVYVYSGIATVVFVIVAQMATYKKIKNLNFIDALKNRIS
ncbi:ABC transporter permease [Gudongella sp. DL1XJH-153]|uniref:ABC transporter permease n=1 Tax=Gudongella sp. DL1XJH-153 TaxID=3409804 RepID=UPI003BB5EFF9